MTSATDLERPELVELSDLPPGFWREFARYRKARRELGAAGTITLRLDECDGKPPRWVFGVTGPKR